MIEPALHSAAASGDVEAIQALLKQGFDINTRDAHGSTALAVAALKGKVKSVRTLLGAGADVLVSDRQGKAVLFYLPNIGNSSIRQLLVEAGERQAASRTDISLGKAVENGLAGKVNDLLQSGAKPEAAALLDAVQRGHARIVRALIDSGADRSVTRNGWKAIHYAAASGSGEVVRLLIEAGSDIEEPTQQPQPMRAIHIAVIFDKPECAAALIEAGADIQAPVSIRKAHGLVDARPVELARSKSMRALFSELSPQPEDPAFGELVRMRIASESPAFREALKSLAEASGHKPAPWKRCRGVWVVFARPCEALAALRKSVGDQGFQLVTSLENEHGVCSWLLFPSPNPFAVLAACGTNGVNHGLTSRLLVRELMRVAERHPFSVTSCGFDFLNGRFRHSVTEREAKTLAARLAKLCPELGPSEREQTVQQITRTGEFFLWWD